MTLPPAIRKTNAQIAAEWRSCCVSGLTWEPLPDQTGLITGEAGGYKVSSPGCPRTGYLKPANAHGEEVVHARAAREKIASDLAQDLHLPVPPAVLTTRLNPPAGCTPQVVVSLIMYSLYWSWGEVRSANLDSSPTGLALAAALARCSSVLAFDTWLDQTDHGDHPQNIVWGFDSANFALSEILFLDYANSMGFNGSWAGGGWNNVSQAPWPAAMLKYVDRDRVDQVVQAIEAFSEDVIHDIVTRVPTDYLVEAQKTVLSDGLIGRRSLVRQALQNVLKEEV